MGVVFSVVESALASASVSRARVIGVMEAARAEVLVRLVGSFMVKVPVMVPILAREGWKMEGSVTVAEMTT